GNTAAGIEVPLDYCKPIPERHEVAELPPCTMLYFQGAPFVDPNEFGNAIGLLWELMDTYDPSPYGFTYTPQLAPYFDLRAEPSGAKFKDGYNILQYTNFDRISLRAWSD
ncbi:MAG: hypothetical protein LBK46_06470, partial [Oscillospiraceae bacterium]|nr:hypothetical protein [Oscillospiraceae bacterium]